MPNAITSSRTLAERTLNRGAAPGTPVEHLADQITPESRACPQSRPVPVTPASQIPEADTNRDNESNPLWIVAIGMASLSIIAALLLGLG